MFSNSISLNDEEKFFYELDDAAFNKVRDTFSKLYPEVFDRLLNTLEWNVGFGLKNHQARELYAFISSIQGKPIIEINAQVFALKKLFSFF